MSLKMEMTPMDGESKSQTRKEFHEEFTKTALSRCECLRCKAGIEFEASAFQEKFRTNLFTFGQKINCPHCGRTTSIYIDNRPIKVAAINLSKT
jgi:Zn finger protein HypA/HybF involved in hydrogenase expression